MRADFMILGVAYNWERRKGLDVFLRLEEALDSRFRIVLVGTDDEIDKTLPRGIISIHRTADRTELSALYTAADVLVNPTRDEVFGLVNAEALACGTPVVTFHTGGCGEIVSSQSGFVVEQDDFSALVKAIHSICVEKRIHYEDCVSKAEEFDQSGKYQEYVELYDMISDGFRA